MRKRDVIEGDGYRLYRGDCLDVLREMPDNSIDAVVTDPPWGVNSDTNYKRFTSGMGVERHDHKRIIGDAEPFDPSPLLVFKYVVLWGANHFHEKLPNGTWLVWDKRFANGKSFTSDGEIGWIKSRYRKPGPHAGGWGVYIHSQTWQGFIRSEPVQHPTQKPVKLMRWCLDMARIPEGATVLDPYMGSGTTGIACLQTGRRFIGVELDPTYFAISRKRLAEAAARKTSLAVAG